MTDMIPPTHPSITALAAVLFKSLLAAILGAACTFAALPRSTAPVPYRSGPLGSGIVTYEGSPRPVEPVGSAGPEAAQYMLVTCLSLVGLLSWRISQDRLGASSDVDVHRMVDDTPQGGTFSSDLGFGGFWTGRRSGHPRPAPVGPALAIAPDGRGSIADERALA